jgi:hypothetical protein
MATDKSKKKSQPARSAKLPAEGVLDRLFAWLDISLVRQTAGELARECQAAVCEATCGKIRGLTAQEAREHIRAVAPKFLEKEVAMVLERRRVRESLRQRILAEAVDQLVEFVIKDVYRTRARRSLRKAA